MCTANLPLLTRSGAHGAPYGSLDYSAEDALTVCVHVIFSI